MDIKAESVGALLNHIGLTANRIGYFYISDAVQLAADDPERLLLVTKWLYPEVAKKYCTNWKAVERDIRYEIDRLKNSGQEILFQLLHIAPDTKLTPAKFIALLAVHFMMDSG